MHYRFTLRGISRHYIHNTGHAKTRAGILPQNRFSLFALINGCVEQKRPALSLFRVWHHQSIHSVYKRMLTPGFLPYLLLSRCIGIQISQLEPKIADFLLPWTQRNPIVVSEDDPLGHDNVRNLLSWFKVS